MKPVTTTVVVNVIVATVLVAYIAVAAIYCNREKQQIICRNLQIIVEDSAELEFVNSDIVRRTLSDNNIAYSGLPIDQIDLFAVEECIRAYPYVSDANAYTSLEGTLNIRLRQRVPMLRVVSDNDHNFYVDSTLQVIEPVAHYIHPVPIVSGSVPLEIANDQFGTIDEKKFTKDLKLLHNIINFVGQVNKEPFLRELIVQIYFEPDGQVMLLPRIGSQRIRFGAIGAEDQESKLYKLQEFYRRSFGQGWWQTTREIDLRFKNQVVCKPK